MLDGIIDITLHTEELTVSPNNDVVYLVGPDAPYNRHNTCCTKNTSCNLQIVCNKTITNNLLANQQIHLPNKTE